MTEVQKEKNSNLPPKHITILLSFLLTSAYKPQPMKINIFSWKISGTTGFRPTIVLLRANQKDQIFSCPQSSPRRPSADRGAGELWARDCCNCPWTPCCFPAWVQLCERDWVADPVSLKNRPKLNPRFGFGSRERGSSNALVNTPFNKSSLSRESF